MKALARLHKWHQTRMGLAIFGITELAAALAITSRAFDTGSILEYILALLLFIGALQNSVRLLRTYIGGPKQTAKT